MERSAQMAIFVHEAERLVVVRLEVEAAGLQSVGDRDLPDRAAWLGQMLGDADRLQHPHRARRDGAGPAVERRVVRGVGSAGSTTIAETPLQSSAEASARPTIPPPKMITSARSMAVPYAVRRNDAKKFA